MLTAHLPAIHAGPPATLSRLEALRAARNATLRALGKWLLVAGSLLGSASALAQDDTHRWEWDRTDQIMMGTALASTAIDWAQTRTISHEPDRCYEMNGLLGRHPSMGRVDRYFAVSMLAETGIAFALPNPYRKIWLGAVTISEVAFVVHNRGIGIKASF